MHPMTSYIRAAIEVVKTTMVLVQCRDAQFDQTEILPCILS